MNEDKEKERRKAQEDARRRQEKVEQDSHEIANVANSMIFGALTDNAILGGIIGGSMAGGMLGDIMNDGSLF